MIYKLPAGARIIVCIKDEKTYGLDQLEDRLHIDASKDCFYKEAEVVDYPHNDEFVYIYLPPNDKNAPLLIVERRVLVTII